MKPKRHDWKNRHEKRDTSWQKVAGWYKNIVRDDGHYYHQHVVIPSSLKLLNLAKDSSVLDVGCGQGVLTRYIPKDIEYYGIDNARLLIDAARVVDKNPHHQFFISDATKPFSFEKKDFTYAILMLSLQNMEYPELVIKNISSYMRIGGKLLIVLNHPSFRIPRQSSWGIDEQNKLQFRRINRYLSPLKIPITAHPGRQQSALTWSFHHPLSDYSTYLYNAGFCIEKIEEWSSDKESVGKASKMENRSRAEIPLFMAILATLNKK